MIWLWKNRWHCKWQLESSVLIICMVYTWFFWVNHIIMPMFQIPYIKPAFPQKIFSTENIFLPESMCEIWIGHSLWALVCQSNKISAVIMYHLDSESLKTNKNPPKQSHKWNSLTKKKLKDKYFSQLLRCNTSNSHQMKEEAQVGIFREWLQE